MAAEKEIAERVERLLAPAVAAQGFRLLEVQYRQEGRWVLRLLIDRASGGGVTLDDCSEISELAGRLLDVEDAVPQAYSLEVSSPGVFRPLREAKHFEQSLGLVARLTLAPEVLPGRRQRTVRGVIEAVEGETVRLALEGETLEVPVRSIRSARLDPEL